mgnify:CR=1 FL=1
MKRLLVKLYLLIRPLLMFFSKIETYLSRKWVQSAYHRMFMLQWQFSFGQELGYFDHTMDLFYQFPVRSEAGWLERGVLNRIALMSHENPIAMELCCGDGFNAMHFYSPCCKSLLCVDNDNSVLKIARKKNCASNIEYLLRDIMKEMPSREGGFHNIICDAALAYFNEKEIVEIIKKVKKRLKKEGIFSGMVGVEYHEGGYVFEGVEDLKRLLKPYFKNVWVYETVSTIKHSLYFEASDEELPFYNAKGIT